MSNSITQFNFGNQSGIAIECKPDGCYVYDDFSDSTEELYIVDNAEMKQLLIDYKNYLVANGR